MIALPFLAGLDEMDDLNQLNDRQLKQACAFQFCTLTNGTAREREQRLLQIAPRIAAEVLVQHIQAKMRAGVYGDRIAERLAADEYAMVARHAVLPLLRSFPVGCGQPQGLTMLDELLRAGMLYERTAALTLIGEKLNRTSMRDPQRMHWLASGAVTDPDRYLGRLQEFVGRHERRISILENYVCRYQAQPSDQQPTPMLEWLIELLGSAVARPESAASARPPLRDPASIVHSMVRAIADRPDRQASDAIERLVSNANLQPWRRYLTDALERQRVLRRDAEYRHPTVAAVCATLNGGTPANAGDLAALLVDWLHEMARAIRDGNTDDWRQYWNVDPYGKPLKPRPENVCRDALLSDLRQHLPDGVDAQPEGQYAHDKRADIRVCIPRLRDSGRDQERSAPGSVERRTEPIDRTVHSRLGDERLRHLPRVLVRRPYAGAAERPAAHRPRRITRAFDRDAFLRRTAEGIRGGHRRKPACVKDGYALANPNMADTSRAKPSSSGEVADSPCRKHAVLHIGAAGEGQHRDGFQTRIHDPVLGDVGPSA